MKFKRGTIKNSYLEKTGVENLFINEIMPDAPSDYVKVYLLALMYADIGRPVEDAEIAKTLRMEEAVVKKAWIYWESTGAVEKDGDTIEFVSFREKLYGNGCSGKDDKKEAGSAEESAATRTAPGAERVLENKPLKELYTRIEMMTGCTISGNEMQEILGWIEDLGATTEMIAYAYRFCSEKGKTNVRYVGKVVTDWASRGLDTKEQIEKFLGEKDQRHYTYSRVMKALGFRRFATENEKKMIDRWLDELDCSMDEILSACGKTSGISNPNLNYVNSVIINTKKPSGAKGPGGVTRAQVMAYYDEIRDREQREADERKEEVYVKVPRVRAIDTETVDLNMKLTKTAIGGGPDKLERLEKIKAEGAALSRERARLLAENDIPVDYMDVKYLCRECGDTGVKDDGSVCGCYAERASEAAAGRKK